MARSEGILYLGTCGPQYVDNITNIRYSQDGLFEYRRGIYFCTHAVAYTKWRARRIWNDFTMYGFLRTTLGSDTIARLWQNTSQTYPISVAANIHWPPNTGHYGLFLQDRGTFSSSIAI